MLPYHTLQYVNPVFFFSKKMSFRNSFSISMAVVFFFLSSFPHKTLSFPNCPATYYNGDGSLPPVTVQFPFVAGTADQFHRCGYPGFNLSSDGQIPIISLPSSGNFTVLQINYSAQIISVSDPNSCLPNRILSLNLTNSPFSGADIQNYTFLNCSKANLHSHSLAKIRNAVAVTCLTGENFTVYMTSSKSAVEKLVWESGQCRPIMSVLAPIMFSRSEILTRFDPGTAFMQLSWNVPDCRRCLYDYDAGVCGFKSKSGLQVRCSGDAKYLVIVLLLKIFIGLVGFVGLTMVIRDCIRRSCAGRAIPGNNNVSNSGAR